MLLIVKVLGEKGRFDSAKAIVQIVRIFEKSMQIKLFMEITYGKVIMSPFSYKLSALGFEKRQWTNGG